MCFLMLEDKEPLGVGLFWCFPSLTAAEKYKREENTVQQRTTEMRRTECDRERNSRPEHLWRQQFVQELFQYTAVYLKVVLEGSL